MRVSAKVDYALRAMLELAAAGTLVKGEQLSTAQAIPRKFLESILVQLRNEELVARPEDVEYARAAAGLQPVWLDLRSAMRDVLEQTTLADIVARSSAPREGPAT